MLSSSSSSAAAAVIEIKDDSDDDDVILLVAPSGGWPTFHHQTSPSQTVSVGGSSTRQSSQLSTPAISTLTVVKKEETPVEVVTGNSTTQHQQQQHAQIQHHNSAAASVGNCIETAPPDLTRSTIGPQEEAIAVAGPSARNASQPLSSPLTSPSRSQRAASAVPVIMMEEEEDDEIVFCGEHERSSKKNNQRVPNGGQQRLPVQQVQVQMNVDEPDVVADDDEFLNHRNPPYNPPIINNNQLQQAPAPWSGDIECIDLISSDEEEDAPPQHFPDNQVPIDLSTKASPVIPPTGGQQGPQSVSGPSSQVSPSNGASQVKAPFECLNEKAQAKKAAAAASSGPSVSFNCSVTPVASIASTSVHVTPNSAQDEVQNLISNTSQVESSTLNSISNSSLPQGTLSPDYQTEVTSLTNRLQSELASSNSLACVSQISVPSPSTSASVVATERTCPLSIDVHQSPAIGESASNRSPEITEVDINSFLEDDSISLPTDSTISQNQDENGTNDENDSGKGSSLSTVGGGETVRRQSNEENIPPPDENVPTEAADDESVFMKDDESAVNDDAGLEENADDLLEEAADLFSNDAEPEATSQSLGESEGRRRSRRKSKRRIRASSKDDPIGHYDDDEEEEEMMDTEPSYRLKKSKATYRASTSKVDYRQSIDSSGRHSKYTVDPSAPALLFDRKRNRFISSCPHHGTLVPIPRPITAKSSTYCRDVCIKAHVAEFFANPVISGTPSHLLINLANNAPAFFTGRKKDFLEEIRRNQMFKLFKYIKHDNLMSGMKVMKSVGKKEPKRLQPISSSKEKRPQTRQSEERGERVPDSFWKPLVSDNRQRDMFERESVKKPKKDHENHQNGAIDVNVGASTSKAASSSSATYSKHAMNPMPELSTKNGSALPPYSRPEREKYRHRSDSQSAGTIEQLLAKKKNAEMTANVSSSKTSETLAPSVGDLEPSVATKSLESSLETSKKSVTVNEGASIAKEANTASVAPAKASIEQVASSVTEDLQLKISVSSPIVSSEDEADFVDENANQDEQSLDDDVPIESQEMVGALPDEDPFMPESEPVPEPKESEPTPDESKKPEPEREEIPTASASLSFGLKVSTVTTAVLSSVSQGRLSPTVAQGLVSPKLVATSSSSSTLGRNSPVEKPKIDKQEQSNEQQSSLKPSKLTSRSSSISSDHSPPIRPPFTGGYRGRGRPIEHPPSVPINDKKTFSGQIRAVERQKSLEQSSSFKPQASAQPLQRQSSVSAPKTSSTLSPTKSSGSSLTQGPSRQAPVGRPDLEVSGLGSLAPSDRDRRNTRLKSLRDSLLKRLEGTEDPLPEEYQKKIDSLVLAIEEANWKSKGASERSSAITQFRQLVMNVRDTKNGTFYRDIVDQKYTAQELATMNVTEMASVEKKAEREEEKERELKRIEEGSRVYEEKEKLAKEKHREFRKDKDANDEARDHQVALEGEKMTEDYQSSKLTGSASPIVPSGEAIRRRESLDALAKQALSVAKGGSKILVELATAIVPETKSVLESAPEPLVEPQSAKESPSTASTESTVLDSVTACKPVAESLPETVVEPQSAKSLSPASDSGTTSKAVAESLPETVVEPKSAKESPSPASAESTASYSVTTSKAEASPLPTKPFSPLHVEIQTPPLTPLLDEPQTPPLPSRVVPSPISQVAPAAEPVTSSNQVTPAVDKSVCAVVPNNTKEIHVSPAKRSSATLAFDGASSNAGNLESAPKRPCLQQHQQQQASPSTTQGATICATNQKTIPSPRSPAEIANFIAQAKSKLQLTFKGTLEIAAAKKVDSPQSSPMVNRVTHSVQPLSTSMAPPGPSRMGSLETEAEEEEDYFAFVESQLEETLERNKAASISTSLSPPNIAANCKGPELTQAKHSAGSPESIPLKASTSRSTVPSTASPLGPILSNLTPPPLSQTPLPPTTTTPSRPKEPRIVWRGSLQCAFPNETKGEAFPVIAYPLTNNVAPNDTPHVNKCRWFQDSEIRGNSNTVTIVGLPKVAELFAFLNPEIFDIAVVRFKVPPEKSSLLHTVTESTLIQLLMSKKAAGGVSLKGDAYMTNLFVYALERDAAMPELLLGLLRRALPPERRRSGNYLLGLLVHNPNSSKLKLPRELSVVAHQRTPTTPTGEPTVTARAAPAPLLCGGKAIPWTPDTPTPPPKEPLGRAIRWTDKVSPPQGPALKSTASKPGTSTGQAAAVGPRKRSLEEGTQIAPEKSKAPRGDIDGRNLQPAGPRRTLLADPRLRTPAAAAVGAIPHAQVQSQCPPVNQSAFPFPPAQQPQLPPTRRLSASGPAVGLLPTPGPTVLLPNGQAPAPSFVAPGPPSPAAPVLDDEDDFDIIDSLNSESTRICASRQKESTATSTEAQSLALTEDFNRSLRPQAMVPPVGPVRETPSPPGASPRVSPSSSARGIPVIQNQRSDPRKKR